MLGVTMFLDRTALSSTVFVQLTIITTITIITTTTTTNKTSFHPLAMQMRLKQEQEEWARSQQASWRDFDPLEVSLIDINIISERA